MEITGGSTTNVNYIKVETQEQGGGNQIDASSNLASIIPTSGALSAYRASYTATLSHNGTTAVHPYVGISVLAGNAVNITLRIGMPQLEQSSYATSPIATSSGTVTRAADVYSAPSGGTYFDTTGTLQQAAVSTPRLDYGSSGGSNPLGILIEESRENYIPDNMMVSAVPADGVERTNNGTFSNTSPNVCTGSVTSSTNTLSCYNGSGTGWVGTVNSGSGTVSASAGQITLTGDGTNAASVYQVVTIASGYTFNVAVTNSGSQAVTVQAGTSVGGTQYLTAKTIPVGATYNYEFTGSGVNTVYIQISNASAIAATVSVVSVQSAGAFPSGWSLGNNDPCLENLLYATGTQNGIAYTDWQIKGTSCSAHQNGIDVMNVHTNAASLGQTWTATAYIAGISGTSAFSIGGMNLVGNNGTSTTESSSTTFTTFATSMPTYRVSVSRTLNNASTTDVGCNVVYNYSSGTTINAIIRVGMPQLELGAFPTSVIPTYGSAVTRTADVFTVPTAAAGSNGAWYTAGVGTLGASGILPYASSDAAGYPGLVALDDGTANNAIHLFINQAPGNQKKSEVINGGTNLGGYSGAAYTTGAVTLGIIAFQTNNVDTGYDGAVGSDMTSVSLPTVTTLRIGAARGGASNLFLDGWDTRIWYMPTRQPDVTLAGYTN